MSSTTTTMTPEERFGLGGIARVEVDGIGYVVYSEPDGSDAYVVEADDYDAPTAEDDYSRWCASTEVVADEHTLRRVARAAGLESVSTGPGVRVYAWLLLDIDEPVLVETMPAHLRASHQAAGNPGVWPDNGAERVVMARQDAEALVEDDDGWTEILRPATEADADEHGVRLW